MQDLVSLFNQIIIVSDHIKYKEFPKTYLIVSEFSFIELPPVDKEFLFCPAKLFASQRSTNPLQLFL